MGDLDVEIPKAGKAKSVRPQIDPTLGAAAQRVDQPPAILGLALRVAALDILNHPLRIFRQADLPRERPPNITQEAGCFVGSVMEAVMVTRMSWASVRPPESVTLRVIS